ncbi:hypothetical protein VNO77_14784 [Canavalia gladiata]|uniref:Uncharacterized protein n=1 Tax=Canavalia gladiata TaxID=3824 RepID=A0AAN9QR42_CANGL
MGSCMQNHERRRARNMEHWDIQCVASDEMALETTNLISCTMEDNPQCVMWAATKSKKTHCIKNHNGGETFSKSFNKMASTSYRRIHEKHWSKRHPFVSLEILPNTKKNAGGERKLWRMALSFWIVVEKNPFGSHGKRRNLTKVAPISTRGREAWDPITDASSSLSTYTTCARLRLNLVEREGGWSVVLRELGSFVLSPLGHYVDSGDGGCDESNCCAWMHAVERGP